MNDMRTASAGPGARETLGRRIGLAFVVLAVGAALIAGAFALAGGGGEKFHSSATAPPPTNTTTTRVASSAPAAAPAVCGDVHGTTVMSDGMAMAPVPHRAPTAADRSAAQHLVSAVDAGIAQYANLSTAIADGYVPATNPRGYIVHYADWSVVARGDVLDTSRPSSLVYANTVSGPLLIGAMFLGPAACQPGPDVAGPLTQWHAHANLCLSATHEVVGRSDASGACTVGTHNTNTFFMMHVWTAASLAKDYQFAADVPRAAYAAIIRSGRG